MLDPTAPNTVEHYTNFDADGDDHDMPNFGAESPPTIPLETQQEGLHPNDEHHASSDQQLKQGDTVYKKAPGAPKRFKSSYVHFFTDFVERKKKQIGPDGLVSWELSPLQYY